LRERDKHHELGWIKQWQFIDILIARRVINSYDKVLIGIGSVPHDSWPLWGIRLPFVNAADVRGAGSFFSWRNTLMTLNNDTDSMIYLIGRSYLLHHKTWIFCPRCASKLESHEAGASRRCPKCPSNDMPWYPRVDPVVITLITHMDSCLLVRQPKHEPGVYTCVAGFLESGETLEECIQREVQEEVGIKVSLSSIRYVVSQPWPTEVGSNLMLGCLTCVPNREFKVDRYELEDAIWFTKEEIRDMLNRHKDKRENVTQSSKFKYNVPGPFTTSHKLMQHWVGSNTV